MTDTPLLSANEIVRRLQAIAASDPQTRYARQAIGMNTIARAAGCRRQSLYEIAAGQLNLGAKAQRKLSAALQSINLSISD